MRSLSRCVGSSLLFFFGFLVHQLLAQVSEQAGTSEIEGHADTSSWALHESGRIFAAVNSTDSVIEYDLDGREVRTFSVEPEPNEMMIKGNHLIVASPKSSSFSVIDLKTNKSVGKIQLAGKGPYGLFCSKVDNGLIYGICNTGTAWWDGEIFQADLATMKVRKRVSVRGWGQSHPLHVAMSSDGKWIVPDARGASSSSGADLMSVDEEAVTFTQVRDHHSSFGQIEAGPANRYWTLGNKLYPLNIISKIRTFKGSPIAIHPEFDLIASYSLKKVSFERFSDAKLFTSVPFAAPSKLKNRSRSSPKGEVLIGFAASGSNVVIANKTRCLIVDLEHLGIPLKPLLLINVATKYKIGVGQEFKLPLHVTNEKLNSRVTYELKKAPEGARISGSDLVWKTTAKDIGPHPIQILAEADDVSDEITIELNVAGPKLELDFDITSMHVNRDGKYAVVWGRKIVKKNGSSTARVAETTTDEVAVINLQNQEVVAQQSMSAGVLTASMQYPYVMVAASSSNIIYRLDAETLSLSDGKRMFIKNKCAAIVPMPKKKVGVITGDHNFLINVIDPETMESTKKTQIPFNPFRSQRGIRLPEVAPDVVDFDTRLLDMNDGTVVMFESNPGLQTLIASTNQRPFVSREMRELSGKTFGRFISRNGIVSATGSLVSSFRNRQLITTPYHPVAFAIRIESQNNNRSGQIKSYLETISLVDGSILDSQVFDVSARYYDSGHRSNHNSRNCFALKETVVYYRQNMLFVIPLDSTLASAPIPLHFPIRKLPVLGVDQPQTISFKANGGKGRLEYQLITEYQGIKLDSNSGLLTINTPSLWEDFVKRSNRSNSYSTRRNSNQKPVTEEQLTEWFGGSSKGKIACVLPIQLAVTDEEAQEDRLSAYVVVMADKSKFERYRAKKRASENFARTVREAENAIGKAYNALTNPKRQAQPRVNPLPRIKAPPKAKNKDLNGRADELDDRLERIESALESVLKKLDQLEDKK